MATIEIRDCGPIEEFRCDITEPGIFVLRGDQGAGKTTVLRTLQLIADGRTDIKPTKRDGAKNGEASFAGKTIRIAKQVRQEGELEVEGLGDLDLAGIHSPPFKDATTRDKHRISGLVRAAGVEAEPQLFHDLVGGEDMFSRLVDPDALKTDDLVEMAARVKRAIEKEAIREETQEKAALAAVTALRVQWEGVDVEAPHAESALQASVEAAIEKRSALRTQRNNAHQVQERAARARASLESMDAGVSVADAESAVEAALAGQQDAMAKVAELERQLEKAREVVERTGQVLSSARTRLEDAARRDAMASEWRADIEAAEAVDCPTEEDIQSAEMDVAAANEALAYGVKVRNALKAKEAAERHQGEAKAHATSAKRLRESARDVQTVLSEAIARIPNCPLFVRTDDDGSARLVMATDRSEAEPIDELSDGERWEPLMAVAAASPNRLIVLPQAAFGEMGTAMRNRLHELAVDHGCFVVTAAVDEGPLRGEAWVTEAAMSA